MADKKPGFFKRIFSFGRKAEAPVPEAETPVEAMVEPTVEPTAEPTVEPTVRPASESAVEPVAQAEPGPVETAPVEAKPAEPAAPPAPPTSVAPAPADAGPKPEAARKRKKPRTGAARPAAPAAATEPAAPVAESSAETTAESKAEPFAEPRAEPVAEAETPAPTARREEPSTPHPAGAPRTGKVTLFEQKPDRPAAAPVAERTGWLSRLRKGLSRSSNALTENIASVFTKRKLDDDTLQELEDLLIRADLGVETAMRITDALSDQRYGKDVGDEEVRQVMAAEIEKVLAPVAVPLELDLEHRPHVILVVGVNGSGKTTTIGKMAAKLRDAGLSTLLVAGDTFRAAAIEQLKIWGERTGSPVIARELGADAAGLAFDAWQRARDERFDVMLMDTAGRLQNKTELMAELEKIIRVLRKHDPSAPHTVLLTLDATTGQNALNQVEIFGKTAGVNGLVMTKLDGTARGGILVAIAARHALPVFFIGVGESVDDLEPFEAADFARSIAGLERIVTEQA